jgi:hypothetical protein
MSTGEPGDVARLRAALASLQGNGQGSVDAGRVFDAVHGRLTAAEREALVEELLDNPDAAEAWRLARELATETAPQTAVEPPSRIGLKWLGVAAAMVLAVGVGWMVLRPAPEPVYRGSQSLAIASALPANAPLPRAEPVLRWTGPDGGRYRVRVLTPELEVLEESDELSTPQFTLSAETLRRVQPGGWIVWQVDARVPDGTAIVSPSFSTRIE